jgi:hypothetical protein
MHGLIMCLARPCMAGVALQSCAPAMYGWIEPHQAMHGCKRPKLHTGSQEHAPNHC